MQTLAFTLLGAVASTTTIVSFVENRFRVRNKREAVRAKTELVRARSLGVALAKGYFFNFLAPLLEALRDGNPMLGRDDRAAIAYDTDRMAVNVVFPRQLSFAGIAELDRTIRGECRQAIVSRARGGRRDLYVATKNAGTGADRFVRIVDAPSTLSALAEYLLVEAQSDSRYASTIDIENAHENPIWKELEAEEYPKFKYELESLYKRYSGAGRNLRGLPELANFLDEREWRKREEEAARMNRAPNSMSGSGE